MASNWALHFASNITDPTQRHNPQFQSWGLAEGCAVILLLLSLKGMKRVTDSRTLASQLGLQLLTSHQLPSGCQLLTVADLFADESQRSQDPQGISLLKHLAMLQKCRLVE